MEYFCTSYNRINKEKGSTNFFLSARQRDRDTGSKIVPKYLHCVFKCTQLIMKQLKAYINLNKENI